MNTTLFKEVYILETATLIISGISIGISISTLAIVLFTRKYKKDDVQ